MQKIRQNRKNVSFEELAQALEDWGFLLVRSKGSHHRFEGLLKGKTYALTIPFHRPVKEAYITEALAIIDAVREDEDDQPSE